MWSWLLCGIPAAPCTCADAVLRARGIGSKGHRKEQSSLRVHSGWGGPGGGKLRVYCRALGSRLAWPSPRHLRVADVCVSDLCTSHPCIDLVQACFA